jgi:hypothetical protein
MLHDESDVPVALPGLIGALAGPVVVKCGAALPRAVDAAVRVRRVAPGLKRVDHAGRTVGNGVGALSIRVVPVLDEGAEGREVVAQELKSQRRRLAARRIEAGHVDLQRGEGVANDFPAPLLGAGLEAHRAELRFQRLLRGRDHRFSHW